MANGIPVINTKILLGVGNFLQSTKQVYNGFMSVNNAINSVGKQMNYLQRSSAQTEVQIKGLTTTLLGMAGTLRSLDKINTMFTSVLGGAYNYTKTLETNAVGISGILTSMIRVNGKQMQWNESMQMSVSIMNELRKQALQTSATAPELIDTFRALLGPGLGAGMKIDEIMKLTKVGVTAVKSIGLDGTQLVQELRSMIQGSIRPASSTLATALGITNTDVKNAKNSAEGLYQFLMKRLNGFEKSVQATAGTVQGRLDILKEGIYQGIEEGTRPLWNDFKDELYALTENFLVIDKKTKEISLNPKFVENVKNVNDTIMTIKNSLSYVIGGLTKDAGSLVKALAIGAIVKISGSAINSLIGLVNKGANAFVNFSNKVSLTNIELEKQKVAEQMLFTFSEKYSNKIAQQQELSVLAKSVSNEIYNLSKRYKDLGANAEQAAEMQNRVVNAINKGKSVEYIEKLIRKFDEYAIKAKKAGDEAINSAEAERIANEQNLEAMKKQLEIKERLKKANEQIGKQFMGSISAGTKDANKEKSYINSILKGNRNEYTYEAFEKRVLQSTLDQTVQAEMLLKVKEKIWYGDFQDAHNLIVSYDKSIEAHKLQAIENEKEAERQKAITRERKTQFEWLNKQIEASIKLQQAQPKVSDEQRRYNLFKHSVAESIADEKAGKQQAKSTKDGKYVNDFISGNTKSKAFTDENVAMVKALMAKVQEAGFSKEYAEKEAKSLINKMQSAKVSAETVKNYYEKSVTELDKVKTKYDEINKKAHEIRDKSLNAGFTLSQATAIKNSYIQAMAEGGREGGNAWLKGFENNLKQAQEKIQGVMRGSMAGQTQTFKMPDLKAKNSSYAFNELSFGYQRTMSYYQSINQQGYEQIRNGFASINKAQQDGMLTTEQWCKLQIEYMQKVAGGYYDEAIAISKVIEKQYQEGKLAQENAQKERQLASEKAKTGAIEKQNAITKQWINELEGNILSQQQRNAIETNVRLALQGKGYANTEQAVKRLLEIEAKMATKIKETGQIAPPVYTEIIKLIQKLTTATQDLTKEELKNIEMIVKTGKEYTKLESTMAVLSKGAGALFSSLTSVGFVLQGIGIESSTTAGKMAEMAIQFGFVGSTVVSLVTSLKELYTVLKGIQALQMLGPLAKNKFVFGSIIFGSAIWGANKYLKNEEAKKVGLSESEKLKRNRFNMSIKDIDAHRNLFDGATTAFGGNDTDDSKAAKKAEQERKRLEALRKQIEDAVQSYKILNETVGISSGKLTGDYTKYQEAIDGAVKKTDQWKKSLKDLVVKSGGALGDDGEIIRYGKITKDMYEETIKSFNKYEDLVKQKAQEDADIQNYENQLSRIKNLEAIKELTTREANERRARTLEEEILYYNTLLEKHNYTEDEKLKYETIIAEKRKALREAEESSGKLSWDKILDHIKNKTLDMSATVTNAYDSMIDSFTNFGQNMFDESKSISERMKDLFSDFAKTIWNMMMKLIMQGLAMKVILGIGNMFGGSKTQSVPSFHDIIADDIEESNLNFLYGANHRANGGYTDGWTLVGEKGPELVNFSTPGRVYTAEQTKKAMNGSGADVNIKIDLKNESGQQLQAETTGSSFDGENYIVGVVLKAISSNRYGMRTTLKGLANT